MAPQTQSHWRYSAVADGQHDKLLRNNAESQEQGERDEGGKTYKLTKYGQLSFPIVPHADKHSLIHLLHHTLHQRGTLVVPLVGLIIVACVVGRIVAAQQDVHHVVVHMGEHVADQDLHTEREGLPDEREVHVQRRPPVAIVPAQERGDQDEEVGLCGQTPVGASHPGHDNGNGTRHEGGDDAGLGQLLRPQVLEEVGRLGHTRAREQQSDERIATEGDKPWLVVVVSDQWCREEQNQIDGAAHQDVKPEDGIIVAGLLFLLVDEGCGEATVLKGSGDQREDGDHGDQAIIRGVEFARQEDAKHEAEQLLDAIVHATPKETLCRFLLQRFHTWVQR